MSISNKTIWRIINEHPNVLTENEIKYFIQLVSYMPDKGCGCILVEKGHVEKAIGILREFVGEFEFEYYPDGFITDTFLDSNFYYGKFEIENLPELIDKFISGGIKIIDLRFHGGEE